MNRVGPYEVLQELGRGGLGVVYEVREPRSGGRFALELLLGGGQASAASRRRFEREVEAMRRIQHPGVVPLIDAGEHEGDAPTLRQMLPQLRQKAAGQ